MWNKQDGKISNIFCNTYYLMTLALALYLPKKEVRIKIYLYISFSIYTGTYMKIDDLKIEVRSRKKTIRIFCSAYIQSTNYLFFVFLACFRAYVGQNDNHIGWTTSMPFASIYPTYPRTNPWNFAKKYLELAVLKNSVFLSWTFWFFLLNPKENQSQIMC